MLRFTAFTGVIHYDSVGTSACRVGRFFLVASLVKKTT